MATTVDFTLGGAARSGGRRQLSEEHISFRMLDLIDGVGLSGAPVWIRDFSRVEEAKNGADLELWFTSSSGASTGWLVQAKRLSPKRSVGSAPSFKELKYKVTGTPQVDLLLSAAKPIAGLTPLYWLYGWDHGGRTSCSGGARCICAPSGSKESLMVAPASWVRRVRGKSWHNVVTASGGCVRPIDYFLCSGYGSGSGLDTIEDLVSRVRTIQQIEQRNTDLADGESATVSELPDYAKALKNLELDADDYQIASFKAKRLVVIQV